MADNKLWRSKKVKTTDDTEIDLFDKLTFRDREWWNKHKIIFAVCIALVLLLLVYEIVVLFKWFFTGKLTDNLGHDIKDNVTANPVTSLTPSEILDISGEVVPIELESDVQMAEDYFDMLDINLEKVREKYPATVAWVKVPGVGESVGDTPAALEYPVAQTTDNEYYLTHSIDGSISRAGWVFLDYREDLTILPRNVILYGHNMADGSIFGKLVQTYQEKWWGNPANQYIYFATDNYSAVYQVFNVMQVDSAKIHYVRRDLTDDNMADYLTEMSQHNLLADKLTYKEKFTGTESVITLSTCADANGAEKYVVQGILVYSKYIGE